MGSKLIKELDSEELDKIFVGMNKLYEKTLKIEEGQK